MIQNLNLAETPQLFSAQTSLSGSAKGGESFSQVLQAVSGNGLQSSGLGSVKTQAATAATGSVSAPNDPLSMLKKVLSQDGISQNAYTVDSKGLDALGEILAAAGYKTDTVSELESQWKSRLGQGTLTLKDIFSDIAKVSQSEKEQNQKSLLDTSAVPFMESILTGFGLPPKDVTRLLNNALSPQKGIDLSSLVGGLKQEQKVLSPTSLKPLDSQTAAMVSRIGLGKNLSSDTGMTLERFIQILEQRVAKDSGAQRQGEIGQSFIQHLDPVPSQMLGAADLVKQVADNSLAVNMKRDFQLAAVKHADRQLENATSGKPATKTATGSSLSAEADKLAASAASRSNPAGTDTANLFLGHAAKAATSAAPNYGQALDTQEQTAQDLQQPVQIDNPQIGDDLRKTSETATRLLGTVDTGVAATGSGAAATTSTVSAQKMPGYVLDQVSRQIVLSQANGENEIRLQLKPPELGRLQMSIESSGQQVKVNIVTANTTTHDLLLAHFGDLKSSLQQQGIHLDRIDVQISQDFGQSMTNAGHGGNPRQKPKRSSGIRIEGLSANTRFIQPAAYAVSDSAALNVVA